MEINPTRTAPLADQPPVATAARAQRILCAHADQDGKGAHWLEPGEKCAAGQPAATDRDCLRLILEALDIPHAACQGDAEIRAKIVDERLIHTLGMLRNWLDDRAGGKRDDDHFAWSLGYLREQLAEHPATGYRTDYAQVMADWAAERAAGVAAIDGRDGAQIRTAP